MGSSQMGGCLLFLGVCTFFRVFRLLQRFPPLLFTPAGSVPILTASAGKLPQRLQPPWISFFPRVRNRGSCTNLLSSAPLPVLPLLHPPAMLGFLGLRYLLLTNKSNRKDCSSTASMPHLERPPLGGCDL